MGFNEEEQKGDEWNTRRRNGRKIKDRRRTKRMKGSKAARGSWRNKIKKKNPPPTLTPTPQKIDEGVPKVARRRFFF